ncbi:MRS7 family protein [Peziza echinospora]|nr:MRS7 family protein [Peziza echinospora]
MNSALSLRLATAHRTPAFQPAFRAAFAIHNARNAHVLHNRSPRQRLTGQFPAFSILQAYRPISTETSTSSSGAPIPPPGFDVNAAKKPLPAEKNANRPASGPSSSPSKTTTAVTDAVESSNPSTPQDSSKAGSAATTTDGKAVTAQKEAVKLTIWQKVKREASHFWDGTKLLGTEIKISWKLALKMAAGYELTRREHRQLQRTVKDLGRLVPFSVFIIVPAGELFLPFALKLFPNMLPSTYEGEKQKDAKLKKLRDTRKSVSDFLRTTLQEGGLPLSKATRQREEFTQFFKKIRATGESPTREELIRVCKIFKDDVTLDNLSRPQLVGMCRYMNLSTFGTDAILRYSVRYRMRQIKQDDRAISYEGVDSLTVPELQNACASRGIRSHGVSPARLREDLTTWLELRLKHGVASTLLVLSNAFMYTQGKEGEIDSHYDALQAVLSSIPEELYHEIELEISAAEGAATNKQRLEVLKEQQELIDAEAAQHTHNEAEAARKEKEAEAPKEKEVAEEKEKVEAKATEVKK